MIDYYVTPEEYKVAESHGIDRDNVDRRIRSLGWSKQKAITKPKRKITDRSKWRKTAEENGICYQTFMTRINVWGWNEERAATEPLQDRRKQASELIETHRIIPKEIIDMATDNGIAYHTLRARIKRGWDHTSAATKPLVSNVEAGRKGNATYKKRYGSFNELIFGVKTNRRN